MTKTQKVTEFFNQLLPVLQMAESDIRALSYHKHNIYEEIAVIHYESGHIEAINISCNSISATMREIVNLVTGRECFGLIKVIPKSLREAIANEEVSE